jgi:hypothetical protein
MYFDYLNVIVKYVALIIFGALPEGGGTRAPVPRLNPSLGSIFINNVSFKTIHNVDIK